MYNFSERILSLIRFITKEEKKCDYDWNRPWYSIKASSKRRQHEFNLSRYEFAAWYIKEPKKCHYCGIPEKIIFINDLSGKQRRLQIDRKDNSKIYTFDNIVLACPTCNLLKSSIFTYEEWLEIAEKYIKPKWKEKAKDVIKKIGLINGNGSNFSKKDTEATPKL